MSTPAPVKISVVAITLLLAMPLSAQRYQGRDHHVFHPPASPRPRATSPAAAPSPCCLLNSSPACPPCPLPLPARAACITLTSLCTTSPARCSGQSPSCSQADSSEILPSAVRLSSACSAISRPPSSSCWFSPSSSGASSSSAV